MRCADSKDRKYMLAITSATARDGRSRLNSKRERLLLGRFTFSVLATSLHFRRRSAIWSVRSFVSSPWLKEPLPFPLIAVKEAKMLLNLTRDQRGHSEYEYDQTYLWSLISPMAPSKNPCLVQATLRIIHTGPAGK